MRQARRPHRHDPPASGSWLKQSACPPAPRSADARRQWRATGAPDNPPAHRSPARSASKRSFVASVSTATCAIWRLAVVEQHPAGRGHARRCSSRSARRGHARPWRRARTARHKSVGKQEYRQCRLRKDRWPRAADWRGRDARSSVPNGPASTVRNADGTWLTSGPAAPTVTRAGKAGCLDVRMHRRDIRPRERRKACRAWRRSSRQLPG